MLKKHIKKINWKKFNHLKAIKLGVVVLAFVLVFSFTNQFAKSSTLDNLSGGAWGMDYWDENNNGIRDKDSNGNFIEPIGGMEWLSFNCTIDNNCANSNYGVNYDPNTGNLEGYAYSAHYGWVKFGGLKEADMPTGPGTVKENAHVDFNDGNKVKGWARFCSPTATPSLCAGNAGKNSTNGGWDGWLSLRGDNYGVIYNPPTKTFSGYAWGGNNGGGTDKEQVVGWVDFSGVSYAPINLPTVTISAQDIYLPQGGQTKVYWDGLNLINSSTGCETTEGIGSQDTGAWANPHPPTQTKNSPSGTFDTGVLNTKGDYIYEIRCKDTTGNIWSPVASVTVHVGIRLFLAPDTFVAQYPFDVDLSWYSDAPLNNCAAYTTDSFGNIQPAWKAPGFTSNVPPPSTEHDYSIANMPAPVRFDLTCFDSGIPVHAQSVYVNKDYNEQLTFSNTKVMQNKTTLKWTTVGMQANSCVPTSSPNNSSWQNPNPKDSSDGSHEQANIDVPAGSNQFTITCLGNSNKSYAVTLTLTPTSGKQSRKYKEN